MPAFSPADKLFTPGPPGIDDIKMPTAAVAAAKAAVVVLARLLVWRHARFLRCSSAKLTRPRLMEAVD
jgi:hypothetical protein